MNDFNYFMRRIYYPQFAQEIVRALYKEVDRLGKLLETNKSVFEHPRQYTSVEDSTIETLIAYINDDTISTMEKREAVQNLINSRIEKSRKIAINIGDKTPSGGYNFAEGLEAYPTNAPRQMTWDEAQEYCASLGDGWRLPTKEELNLMYTNLKMAGLGGFSGARLWSSSQNYSNDAWVQYFSYGDQYNYNKNYDSSVRACRAF